MFTERTCWFAVICVLSISLLAGMSPASAASMTVWVAPDCLKVERDAPAGGASTVWSPSANRISVKGARNEYVAFQVIVKAPAEGLNGVNVSVTDLKGPAATIASSNVQLFREHYLHVTEPSTSMYGDPSSEGTGWYPDALVPFSSPVAGAPFSVAGNLNQGVWVDVNIPKGMMAGTYNGTLTVTAGGQAARAISLRVEVYDFMLPEKPSMKTWFYFGQDELANGHHVAKYDEHYRRLEQMYYRMAREHRFNIDAPVYWDYSGTGDAVTIDWDSYHDELAGPLYDGTIFGDGYGMDPICLPVNSGFPSPDDHGGLYSDEFARTFRKTLQLVKQHFDAKGWTSRAFLWVLDEPNSAEAYDQVRRYGQLVDESGTGLPLMVTEQPEPQDPAWGSLIGAVDIWCAGSGSYVPANMSARRAAGERTWTYNGGRPYAGSQLLDTPGEAMATWGWLARKYGVQCWLYWHCMYWKDIYNDPSADNDVWSDPLSFDQRRGGGPWPDWGNGDGVLFYPGYDVGVDGPVSSIRMKMLRRGLQDYEYMALLGSEGKSSVASDAVDSVVSYGMADAEGKPVGWSSDPDEWEAARSLMASNITRNDFPVRSTSYLAEGTTRDGFEEWICVMNPTASVANVSVQYMLASGENRVQNLTVAAHSRSTIDVNGFLGPDQDASAQVTSDQDVIVERPMYFDYHGKWTGGHNVMGAASAGRSWHLAEGTTRDGFEEWICVMNPTASVANVSVQYMLASGENRVQNLTVAAHSRSTIDVNGFLGPDQDASAQVTSDQDVIVERPMYFDYHGKWTGGHNVMGAASAGRSWHLAEGTTRDGFEEWICVMNPTASVANVSVQYMLASGENRVQNLTVAAHSRSTIDVNGFLGPDQDASAQVTSDQDVIVERPMYFDYHGKWTGGHNVMGAASAGRSWHLAEGTTRDGFEEWICVMNPTASVANVSVQYMLASGENRVQNLTVAAHSRSTIDVNGFLGPDQDASAQVTSDQDVIVERPMYFDYHGKWTGGHNVMGHHL